MENPFVVYSKPVEGEDFVGRDDILQKIQKVLLKGGSCSLSGLRRIGKTSIAMQIKKNIDNSNMNFKTCYIPMDSLSSEAEFYKELAQQLLFDNNKFFETEDSDDMYRELRRHLALIASKESFNAIAILDEFDFLASGIFHNAALLINRIRELINVSSKYHLYFLFVSAKSLRWLQNNTANISTLSGICQAYYLRPFDKHNGLAALLKRGNIDSPEILDTIFQITGGHPYLSSALLHWLFELKGSNIISPDLIQDIRIDNNCTPIFSEYYECLKKFFSSWQNENVWDSLRNATVGPYIQEPTTNAIDLLTTYGIIDDNGNCFSEDFHEYLKLQCRQTPIWPQIANLEHDLRYLIKTVFIKQMGNNWIDELKKEDAFFENLFGELEQIMKKEQKKFNRGNYSDILEYSYLYNLKDIILRKWSWFQKYLGDSKPHFLQLIEPICVIRNPLAHNRKPELIPHDKQDLAKNACSELEGILSQSFEKLMAD